MKQEDVAQMQFIEQSIQQVMVQKQSIQSQLVETESALEELTSDVAWKIVGNIMVKTSAKTLRDELSKKKASFSDRITVLEKQEQRLREKAQSLQKSIMEQADGSR